MKAARLSGFGTSIFTEITRLALEHGAVNLGQGFPDFPAPAFVKEAAARAIAADHNQYAAAPGVPRLRQAIATRWQKRTGRTLDWQSEITVTGGATEALFDAILAVVDPGDEVIVFEPTYDSYAPAVQMAGGVVKPVALRPLTWDLDELALSAAFSTRTKLVIVNSPHNPTGKVWSVDELDVVARLCQQHNALALCDEVYSELTYDGASHVSLATRPGMETRTITVDSVGKTFSVTGWKIGWAVASPELSGAVRGVHQFVTFCNSTPFQEAAADALNCAEEIGFYGTLRAEYRGRRERLRGLLDAAGLPSLPAQGAYFLLTPLGDLPFDDDVAFCRWLTKAIGVAAIPPSAFYTNAATAPRLARFCFAKSDETLTAAGARLRGLRAALP